MATNGNTHRVISELEEEDEASAMAKRGVSWRGEGYVDEEKNVGEGQLR